MQLFNGYSVLTTSALEKGLSVDLVAISAVQHPSYLTFYQCSLHQYFILQKFQVKKLNIFPSTWMTFQALEFPAWPV